MNMQKKIVDLAKWKDFLNENTGDTADLDGTSYYDEGFVDGMDMADAWFDAQPIVEMLRWIPVKERMPKAEQPVLVVYMFGDKPMVTKAIYEDGTILSDDSFLNWSEIWEYGNYDEESDSYFIPRGWWEYGDFAEFNNGINYPITHWMPLPEPPEEE